MQTTCWLCFALLWCSLSVTLLSLVNVGSGFSLPAFCFSSFLSVHELSRSLLFVLFMRLVEYDSCVCVIPAFSQLH